MYYESYYGTAHLGTGNYLQHHGILGMKWGVRRYQNKDGSLTKAGQKRYLVTQQAADYAAKQAKSDRLNAKDYADSAIEYKKKYMTKDGEKRWLDETFGDDWKTESGRKYLDDVFELKGKTPEQIAKKAIMEEYTNDVLPEAEMMEKIYNDTARDWDELEKKFRNTPVGELSDKDFKKAKRLARKIVE